MSKSYNEYFKNNDYNEGMAELLYDIKEHRITFEESKIIINKLVSKNKIPTNSNFVKKNKKDWNKDYLNYLMGSSGVGAISKEYLIYYSEVANYVAKKKRCLIIAVVVILGVVVTSTIIGAKLLNSESKENDKSTIQEQMDK